MRLRVVGSVAAQELNVINEQYPFQPLKFLPKTLRLPFEEGINMLKEDGLEVRKPLPFKRRPCCS